jgi:acetyltransferase EpsM
MAGARVMPNTRIGNHAFVLCNVYIGHDCVIQDYATITNSAAISGFCEVEEGCYVGSNSSIRERTVVGKWSLVGLGSVVLENVPPFSVVVGNPSRILRVQDPVTFNV